MSDPRKPVAPLPPRWKPSKDPSNINVPGLDTDASVTDQIEQIEQLITIKLQNIDENFSKIHSILSTRILPSVKRYANGTEPVREAAKFWTSFYEQAAQIRIPTFDEHSTVNEISSEQEEETATDNEQDITPESHDVHDRTSMLEPSMNQTDSSFMPSHAISSTPATGRVTSSNTMDSFSSDQSGEPSWANSMESPLLRLKNEIENFSSDGNSDEFTPARPSTSSVSNTIPPTPERTDVTILPPSTKGKGKGKAKEQDPLLRNVLRHNLYSNQSVDEFNSNVPVSPMKFKVKPKTPIIPKTFNPYLPPDSTPSEWNGVVDLSDASVLTPQRHRPGKRPASHRKPKTPVADDSDDSFDGLPKGMSPPVLMSPARPPRSSAELGLLKVGQSPLKQAAARITQDLLRDVRANANSARKGRGYYGISENAVESSMSTVSTPPSLSKYNRGDDSESVADSTLDSMLRRVGLDGPSTAGLNSTPGLRLRPKVGHGYAGNQFAGDDSQDDDDDDSLPPIGNPLFTPGYLDDDQYHRDSDSDSDSDPEINTTSSHPSAAFLMASQGLPGADDSFGSSNHSSDSLGDDGVGGLVPSDPFAAGVQEDRFEDEDSFDDDLHGDLQEETVFGVPPAQRQAQANALAAAQRAQGLRMLGGDLLDDTMGATNQWGGVAETPTPAWGNPSAFR